MQSQGSRKPTLNRTSGGSLLAFNSHIQAPPYASPGSVSEGVRPRFYTEPQLGIVGESSSALKKVKPPRGLVGMIPRNT